MKKMYYGGFISIIIGFICILAKCYTMTEHKENINSVVLIGMMLISIGILVMSQAFESSKLFWKSLKEINELKSDLETKIKENEDLKTQLVNEILKTK